MNDILTPVRSLDRSEQSALADLQALPQRISPIDRLSLRVGLWLLLRSTRHIHRIRSHDDHARVRAAHRARWARERAAERRALLSAPRS